MNDKEIMEIKINAYQIIEKTVKPSGNLVAFMFLWIG